MNSEQRTAEQKVALIAEVYDVLIRSTESLELDDMLGPDFAYFVGAVLKDTSCAWPEERPFIQVLRANFSAGHAVWSFIEIEQEEEESDLPTVV